MAEGKDSTVEAPSPSPLDDDEFSALGGFHDARQAPQDKHKGDAGKTFASFKV